LREREDAAGYRRRPVALARPRLRQATARQHRNSEDRLPWSPN